MPALCLEAGSIKEIAKDYLTSPIMVEHKFDLMLLHYHVFCHKSFWTVLAGQKSNGGFRVSDTGLGFCPKTVS